MANLLGNYDYPDRISAQLHWLSRNNSSIEDYIQLVQSTTIEEIVNYIEYLFSSINEFITC